MKYLLSFILILGIAQSHSFAQQVPQPLSERYHQHKFDVDFRSKALEDSTLFMFLENTYAQLNGGLKDSYGSVLDIITDQITSTNTVRDFWHYAEEPKREILNTTENSNLSRLILENFITAIARAEGALFVLQDSTQTLSLNGKDVKKAAIAQSLFMRGMSKAYTSLLFDQSVYIDSLYRPQSDIYLDLDSLTVDFASNTEFLSEGLSDLEQAIDVLTWLSDEEFEWFISPTHEEISRSDFIKAVHSFIAKIMISSPREPNAPLYYEDILYHAYKGLDDEYPNFIIAPSADGRGRIADYYSDWSSFLVSCTGAEFSTCSGYLPTDVKVMHLLNDSYPTTYPIENANGTVADYPANTSDDPRLNYFQYTTNAGFLRDTRNPGLYSNYYSKRQYAGNNWWDNELPLILMTRAELQYIIAEAEFMMGNSEATNTALQNSPYGSVASDFEPDLWAKNNYLVNNEGETFNGPEIGNDYEAFIQLLHKEYAVEIGSFTTIGTHLFFMRRHGLLQKFAPTQLPLPAGLLDYNGQEIYTFGGVGGFGSIGTADGSNAWRSDDLLPTPSGLSIESRNKELAMEWDSYPLAFNHFRLVNEQTNLDTLLSKLTTSFLHKGLENGATYNYKLSVVDSTQESDQITISSTPNVFGDFTQVPYQGDMTIGNTRTTSLEFPNFSDTTIFIHSITLESTYEDSTNEYHEHYNKYGFKQWREEFSLSLTSGEISPQSKLNVDLAYTPQYFNFSPFNRIVVSTSEGDIELFFSSIFVAYPNYDEVFRWSGYYGVPDTIAFGYVEVGDSLSTTFEVENNHYWAVVKTSSQICPDFKWPCSNANSDFAIESLPDTVIIPTGEAYEFTVTVKPTTVEPQTGIFNMYADINFTSHVFALFEVNGAPRNIVTSTEERELVSKFELFTNYPNPFNPSTNIQFTIPQATNVQLDIFNILGQKVQTLVSGKLNAGLHTYTFSASSLSSGVYLYRIHAGSSVQTKRMLLIK